MKNIIKLIRSFDDIKLKPNTLILSDIDETILKFDQVNQTWWKNNFNSHYLVHNDYAQADEYAFSKWIEVISITKPSHTDHTGFFRLLGRVQRSNSEIEFITARNSELILHTSRHFEDLELNYMDFQVHHLGGFSKGKYIQSMFGNKLSKYDHIIFIDDLEHNILSVLDNVIHPSLQTYQFVID